MRKRIISVSLIALLGLWAPTQAGGLLAIPASPSTEGAREDPTHSNEPIDENEVEEEATESEQDPLEPLNRVFFAFNEVIDGLILRPASLIYRAVLPEPVRDGIGNALNNLLSPVTLINHVLQGRLDRAGETIVRFAVNSTAGVLGFADVAATTCGIEGGPVGFDDTLAMWGIEPGAYVMIPILGPSTLRGALGIAGDYYADPINYYYTHKGKKNRSVLYVRAGLEMVDHRHRVLDAMDQLSETSVDLYAAIRSIHYQRLAYKRERLAQK